MAVMGNATDHVVNANKLKPSIFISESCQLNVILKNKKVNKQMLFKSLFKVVYYIAIGNPYTV